MDEDGRTTRTKAARPEHPGEEGIQPKSQRTVYIPETGLGKLDLVQTRGDVRYGLAFDSESNRVAVKALNGPNQGALIKGTVTPFSVQPTTGLVPVEYWGDDKTIHFGNKITEVITNPEPARALTYGTKAAKTVQAETQGRKPQQAPTAPEVDTAETVAEPTAQELAKARIEWDEDYGPEGTKFSDLDKEGQKSWAITVRSGKPTIEEADFVTQFHKKTSKRKQAKLPVATDVAFTETEPSAPKPEGKATSKRAAKASRAQAIADGTVSEQIAKLPTEQVAQLEEHYGDTADSESFLQKVKADVVKFATEGARAVSASIRQIIRSIHAGVLSVAMIFNPMQMTSPEAFVSIPKAPTVVETTTTREVRAELPSDVKAMSEAGRQAYSVLIPALKGKIGDKLITIADKPSGRIFVFDSDGNLIVQKKTLYGLAKGDLYKGNNDLPQNRITPAGLFGLKLVDAAKGGSAQKTAGDYDFGKVFAFEDPDAVVTIMHSVWLKERDAQQRAAALRSDNTADSRYSFGCINVDRDTYKMLLDNYQSQMDGSKLFIVPDNQAAVGDFLSGNVPYDKMVRESVKPVTETVTTRTATTEDTAKAASTRLPEAVDRRATEQKRGAAPRRAKLPEGEEPDIEESKVSGADFLKNLMHEQAIEEAALEADYPDGPFTDAESNVVAAKSVDPRLAGYVRSMMEKLGLGNVRVLLVSDASDLSDPDLNLHGSYNINRLLDKINRGTSSGLKTKFGPDKSDFVIYVRKGAADTNSVETTSHELGHIIQDVAFDTAPANIRAAVLAEFQLWRESTEGLKTRELAQSVYPPFLAKRFENEPDNLKFNDEYLRNFREWFANNVARWATTDKKAVTIVDKFFKGIADTIKRFVSMLTGDRYLPAQSVADFLNAMGPDTDVSFVPGVLPTVSTGQLTGEQTKTDTPEFKQFFRKSEIVTAAGKPKVMYHGTARDIRAFRAKQAGAIFVTPSPIFAEGFAYQSEEWVQKNYRKILSEQQIAEAQERAIEAVRKEYGNKDNGFVESIRSGYPTGEAQDIFLREVAEFISTGPNIIPVYVRAENPFDYENKEQAIEVFKYVRNNGLDERGLSAGWLNDLYTGNWPVIENSSVQKAIKALGYDSFYVKEGSEKNLAVYSPTQIKSVFNRGTFDPNAPEIDLAYVPDNITRTSELSAPKPTAVTRAIRSMAGEIAADDAADNITRFRTINVDASASVAKKISAAFDGKLRDTLGNINPLPQLRQANDYGKLLISLFENGAIVKDPNTGLYEAKQVNGVRSAKDAFDILAKWAKDNKLSFDDAKNELSKMLEARRLDYFRRNPQLGVPLHKLSNRDPRSVNVQIDTMLAKFNAEPQLKEVAGILQKMRERMVEQMYEAGRITKDDRDLWIEAVEYIPFDRMEEFATKFKSSRRTGRGLTSLGNLPEIIGSERRETQNVLDNQIRNYGWMLGQILNNDAARATLRTLERIGAAQYRGHNPHVAPEHKVRVFIDGEERFFELPSRWDVKAFTALALPKSWTVQQMGNFSNMLRTTVTALPPFALKQVTDDIQRAFVLSGVKNPYALIFPILRNFLAVAWYEITGRRHPLLKDMSRKGIAGEYDFDYRDPASSILQDFGYVKRPWFKEMLHRMEGITRASDLAVRAAIYERVMKETKNELLATTKAREFINFRRRGAGQLIGTATATIPFFNAYVQSMDLLYRNATGTDVQSAEGRGVAKRMFIAQLAKLAAFAAIYAMAVEDDDDYKGMDLRTRNSNWIIPGLGKLAVPNELAAITKVPVEMALEYLKRQGTKEEMEAADATVKVLSYAFEQFGGRVVPIPTALRPVIEAVTNYSFLGGRQLEGIYQSTLDPEQRTTPNTSELAKAIGQASKDLLGKGVSPIMVDNFLSQWFGTTSATVTMLADGVLNPDKMDRPLHKYFLLSNYMYDPVPGRGRTEAYELREKYGTKHNTLLKLAKENPDAALRYAEANQKELIYAKFANGLMEKYEQTRKFKAYIESPQAAKNMTREERAKAMEEIKRMENEVGLQNREFQNIVRKGSSLRYTPDTNTEVSELASSDQD